MTFANKFGGIFLVLAIILSILLLTMPVFSKLIDVDGNNNFQSSIEDNIVENGVV